MIFLRSTPSSHQNQFPRMAPPLILSGKGEADEGIDEGQLLNTRHHLDDVDNTTTFLFTL